MLRLCLADQFIGIFTLGFGLVFGFQYKINPNFLVTLETIPSTSLNFNFGPNSLFINGNIIGLNTNNIEIGLLYKFKKE